MKRMSDERIAFIEREFEGDESMGAGFIAGEEYGSELLYALTAERAAMKRLVEAARKACEGYALDPDIDNLRAVLDEVGE